MRLLPAVLLVASTVQAQSRPRARDLGVPFDGTPGPLNAITDVAGVTVGHATIIKGEGRLVVGQGPVRTGVTAIFPRGATDGDPSWTLVAAAWPLLADGSSDRLRQLASSNGPLSEVSALAGRLLADLGLENGGRP